MNTLLPVTLLISTCLLLSACGGAEDAPANETSTNVVSANDVEPSKPFANDATPVDEPEIGTDVEDVIDTQAASAEDAATKDYRDVLWDDLLPEDFQPEKILARYQQEIQDAPEGSVEERVLFDKVMTEFNNAGANDELNGVKVRIPGYVAPLDTNGDMVGDFLLVPYYGSCIHSPPPPAHQTVMINPQAGKSINLRDTYRPVWVIGELTVENIETDLAPASYQIRNAVVKPYRQPIN